jgi:hypothetical protein
VDDNATGCIAPTAQPQSNGNIYNLLGQQLSSVPNGIFIQNGRKVIKH